MGGGYKVLGVMGVFGTEGIRGLVYIDGRDVWPGG